MVAKDQNEKLRRKLAALEDSENVEDVNIEDLGLDFTVPGYDIELRVCHVVFVSSHVG